MCEICKWDEQTERDFEHREAQEVEQDNHVRAELFLQLPASLQTDRIRGEFYDMTPAECREYVQAVHA
jgi:hypothetical protein